MSSFTPIPELRPKNNSGLVYVVFLTSGNILFSEPTNDGWFGGVTNATEIHKFKGSDWGNTTMFRQSEPGSPLACEELDQYCFTDVKGERKCSPVGSSIDALSSIYEQLDEGDAEWFNWFEMTTFEAAVGTERFVEALGSRALRARDSLNGPILGPLPDKQWQVEVQHWNAAALAYMQDTFLRAITGPKDRQILRLMSAAGVVYPTTETDHELCANQVC